MAVALPTSISARLILRLAEKVAKRNLVRTQTFDFPLRQRHIADATGLTPVYVSKVLGELQRAGLIKIASRSLKILNGPELLRVRLALTDPAFHASSARRCAGQGGFTPPAFFSTALII